MAAGSYAVTVAPASSNFLITSMAGESRISSVPPLNASPRAASRLPRRVHKRREHLVEEDILLSLVDLVNLLEELEVDALLLSNPVEGGHVLWKAGPAIAQPGAQKLGTDPAVEANAGGDLFDVCVDRLGQVGYRIDKRYLQGQKTNSKRA
jgi:hypothetical protein